jgi:hypothetical protein
MKLFKKQFKYLLSKKVDKNDSESIEYKIWQEYSFLGLVYYREYFELYNWIDNYIQEGGSMSKTLPTKSNTICKISTNKNNWNTLSRASHLIKMGYTDLDFIHNHIQDAINDYVKRDGKEYIRTILK